MLITYEAVSGIVQVTMVFVASPYDTGNSGSLQVLGGTWLRRAAGWGAFLRSEVLPHAWTSGCTDHLFALCLHDSGIAASTLFQLRFALQKWCVGAVLLNNAVACGSLC